MPSLIPYQLVRREGGLSVLWLTADSHDFGDPFFGITIDRLLTQTLKKTIVKETSVTELFQLARQCPEFLPTGFIYHVSRCGSTLLSNMLSSIAEHLVLAEPTVPLGILGKNLIDPLSDVDSIPEMLRASLVAFCQSDMNNIRRLFLKFFSGNIFQLQIIRRTFPGVREVFLYRDPVEVIVSNVHGPVQGWLWIEAITGVPFSKAIELSIIELAARAIGRKMAAMRNNYQRGKTLLMNYSEIGAATPQILLDFFRIPIEKDILLRMTGKLPIDSKDPEQARLFAEDSSRKQELAGIAIRRFAEEFAYPAYHELEALRVSHDEVNR